jgi:LTXXQ motif family protein
MARASSACPLVQWNEPWCNRRGFPGFLNVPLVVEDAWRAQQLEMRMLKGTIALLGLLLVAGPSAGYAQSRINQADLNALTDARIGIVKAALQMTPDQAQYWPAIEDAIRARAQTRYARIEAVANQLGQGHEVDPIALMRGRADALAQRAVGLKKLVDAWEPLYRSLAPDQKERMRFLVSRVIPVLSAAVDPRRSQDYDEDDPDMYLFFGDSPGQGTIGFAPH